MKTKMQTLTLCCMSITIVYDCTCDQNFNSTIGRNHQKHFNCALRLWVGGRDAILGYLSKIRRKKELMQQRVKFLCGSWNIWLKIPTVRNNGWIPKKKFYSNSLFLCLSCRGNCIESLHKRCSFSPLIDLHSVCGFFVIWDTQNHKRTC